MQRHPFAPVSLVFGAVFTGIGLLFLQGDVDVWRVDWSWFWPAMLTLAGVLVLASALTNRTAPAEDEDEPLQPLE